jgi:hypothetical protein
MAEMSLATAVKPFHAHRLPVKGNRSVQKRTRYPERDQKPSDDVQIETGKTSSETGGRPEQKWALRPSCVHTQNTARVERKRFVLQPCDQRIKVVGTCIQEPGRTECRTD